MGLTTLLGGWEEIPALECAGWTPFDSGMTEGRARAGAFYIPTLGAVMLRRRWGTRCFRAVKSEVR